MKKKTRRYYYLYGSGCCFPSVIALSSPEIDTEYFGLFKTDSLEIADVIILYGCINREAEAEFEELILNCGRDIPIIKAGKCILRGCAEYEANDKIRRKIAYSIESCPFQPEELMNAVKKLLKTKEA
ncbi:TPA: hypothetical protein DCW38_08050 [candidate division WOR-3 bacterium]|jgi:Ni,Fe-hydrogenase III small subunit|uniref:NADH:ubiquinone oxidoreductase-like 20kDa subunit domain-containing protein n=1 Tax=candidate division WOR-3 bacterium TaxID=2052148 RepID=A0A350HC48_UNCW3|nr:hypothetical protein [candidate division WOR-3 bacterium]